MARIQGLFKAPELELILQRTGSAGQYSHLCSEWIYHPGGTNLILVELHDNRLPPNLIRQPNGNQGVGLVQDRQRRRGIWNSHR
jgi:hypothetical protein